MTQTFRIDDVSGSAFMMVPGMEPRPVVVWGPNPDKPGKQMPTDRQDTTSEGVPLWEVDVVARPVAWGNESAEIVTLRWAEMGTPTCAPGMETA